MTRLPPSLQSIESAKGVTAPPDEVYHDDSSICSHKISYQSENGWSPFKKKIWWRFATWKTKTTCTCTCHWRFDMMSLIDQNFAKRSVDFVKLELGVFIVHNICAFVWTIQETVLLLFIANSCDNTHGIGQPSNYLLLAIYIYTFGHIILLHNDYFDDNSYNGFYF